MGRAGGAKQLALMAAKSFTLAGARLRHSAGSETQVTGGPGSVLLRDMVHETQIRQLSM